MAQGLQSIPKDGDQVPTGPWNTQRGTSTPLERGRVCGPSSAGSTSRRRDLGPLTLKKGCRIPQRGKSAAPGQSLLERQDTKKLQVTKNNCARGQVGTIMGDRIQTGQNQTAISEVLGAKAGYCV